MNLRFKVESHSGAMECTHLILACAFCWPNFLMHAVNDLKALRLKLRQQRQAIPPHQRLHFENRVAGFLEHWWYLAHCRKIACYLAVNGEFPTGEIIRQLHAQGKQVYLPLLAGDGDNRLVFQQIAPRERMVRNRFGIPEPVRSCHRQISPERLDLVITPLVGFNRKGVRLGMGGGYYDRSFAFTKARRLPMRPFMLGLGFALQQVDDLTPAPWDVPMDAILTEKGLIAT